MNASTRTLATTTMLALVAALSAACERTPTPQTSRSGDGDAYATTLSAPAAPSLAGTPIEETPATHKIAVAPLPPEEPTARDTPANLPAATLGEQKEKNELPLAGQVNNHSSEAFKSGRDESSSGKDGSAPPTGTTQQGAAPVTPTT